MGPGKAPVGAVYVMVAVGVGVVIAVIGHPADRTTLGGTAADDRQDVFEPPRPGGEATVRQQTVVRHTDTDAARQPVKDQADAERGP